MSASLGARSVAALPVVVACVVVLASLAAFRRYDRDARIRDVSASAVYAGDAAFSPWKTVDGCGVEAPRTDCYFLLPDATPGFLRYELDGEHRLERIELLDTQNRGYRDRGTSQVRIELVGRDAVVLRASLPPHPRWHSVDLGGRRADSVVVHLDRHRGLGAGLDEVVLVGTQTSGFSWAVPWLVSLGLGLGALFVARRLLPRLGEPALRSRTVFFLCALGLVLVAWDRLRFSSGVSIFEWCLLFDVRELDSWERTKAFFRELRVPIPPLLAFVEWLAYRATGSSTLVTRWLYGLSILGSYLLALRLAFPSIPRMLVTACASTVLIAGTAAVHPGNPQVYDVVFPALALAFVRAVSKAVEAPSDGRASRIWAFVAGFALASLGLTRPFGILLVPAAIAVVLTEARFRRPRTLVAIVLPVAILFGGFHAHLLRTHHQLTMSNHAGHNLARAWPEVPLPPLLLEPTEAPWRRLNNPVHSVNDRRIVRAVARYLGQHPLFAARRVGERVVRLLSPQTLAQGDRFVPLEDWLGAYRWTVRFLVLLFASGIVARLGERFLRTADEPSRSEASPPGVVRDLLFVLVALTVLVTAFGESGEEGRFVVALLPMLAAAPSLLPARRC